MTAISKRFPGVQALDRADLLVERGEVHGLVGENGAGKSTIIKVLAGVYRCDDGVVEIGGTVVDPITPQVVHDLGVRFIHQELNLVPHFTVAESVFMGQEKSGLFGIQKRAMRAAAEAFLHDALRADIDGNALIRALSVADRKLVQIARALIDGQARLVVFDEPTAVLPAADVDSVFESIRVLKERGIAMVYVSHYLAEITEICDRVTVFRNGRTVGVVDDAAEAGVGEIIKLMVGRDLGELFPEKNRVPAEPVLQIENLSDGRHFRGVSFEVCAGETVGLAGLVGSGREELVDAIYGMRRIRTGSVKLNSEQLQLGDAADAVAKGLVLVPRDRRNHGLVLGFSVGDNINLASLDEVAVRGWLKPAAATARANGMIEKIDVRPRDPNRIARFLSGGNQQKVVLARWLVTKSTMFLMDEPTVGVDVGAKAEIYRLIAELASAGAGVLVASHDLGELMGLCDRVLVMVRGEIVANERVEDLTLDELLALTTASQSEAAGKAS
ncbi:MAG: sugar ABC transporter ATP-binding protein [Actinobacteria bacterium]|nr:sugar ABC transporter ATP-binding protein [Actinomycetota bacterium]